MTYKFNVYNKEIYYNKKNNINFFIEGENNFIIEFVFMNKCTNHDLDDYIFNLYIQDINGNANKIELDKKIENNNIVAFTKLSENNILKQYFQNDYINLQLESKYNNIIWKSKVLCINLQKSISNLSNNNSSELESEKDYYNKLEVDNIINNLIISLNLDEYYKKQDLYPKNDINQLLDNKLSKNFSDTVYSKQEVDNIIDKVAKAITNYCSEEFVEKKFSTLKENIVENSADIQQALSHIDAISTSLAEEYYTTEKIDILLLNKPNYSELSNIISKAIDESINDKANKNEIYTKSEIDNIIQDKIKELRQYIQSNLDNIEYKKVDKSDIYSKIELDSEIQKKANQDEVYNKDEVNNLIDMSIDKLQKNQEKNENYFLTSSDGSEKQQFDSSYNIDNIIESGNYFCNGVINSPINISGLLQVNKAGNYIFQVYYGINGSIYNRVKMGLVWISWKKSA